MRELSFKLKEAETPKHQIDETSYQDKIKRYSDNQKFISETRTYDSTG